MIDEPHILKVTTQELNLIAAALQHLAAGSRLMAQGERATPLAKEGDAAMSKPLTAIINKCLEYCPDMNPIKLAIQSERTSCALVAESHRKPRPKTLDELDPITEAYNKACIDIETAILCRE